MKSLDELVAEQQGLQRAIDEARRAARGGAIAEIQGLMATHGLTAADIAAKEKTSGKGPKSGVKLPARYRHPATGAAWSGRGLRPKWLVEELARGRSLVDFAVDGTR